MSILAGFHVRTKSDLPKGSELHVIQENSDNDGPPSLDYDQEAPVNSTHNKPYLAPTRLFDSNQGSPKAATNVTSPVNSINEGLKAVMLFGRSKKLVMSDTVEYLPNRKKIVQ